MREYYDGSRRTANSRSARLHTGSSQQTRLRVLLRAIGKGGRLILGPTND